MVDDHDFERLETKVDRISEGVNELRVTVENRVTRLEVKTGLWGVVGGAVVAAVSAFIGWPKH